jgi:hypothetical protein
MYDNNVQIFEKKSRAWSEVEMNQVEIEKY